MQKIEEIYEQYSTTIYKYLFCLTKNPDLSEELTQETFLVAIKKIDQFRGESKLTVWLCQIAKHLWYKELKKNKKQPDNISVKVVENKESSLDKEMLTRKKILKSLILLMRM